MKAIIFVALLVVVAQCNIAQQQFDEFCREHDKTYVGQEYDRRLKIFTENMRIVGEHQKNDPSATYGYTKFFDMSYEEWKATYLADPVPSAVLAPNCLKHGIYRPKLNKFQLPTSFDWRDHDGVVTKVKDQASCGSCWAFSTAANIEGVLGAAGKPTGDLSPQQIVDCSKACTSEIYNGNNITVCNGGCNGGWPWSAFWDIDGSGAMNGLVGWDDYPYTGYSGSCKTISSPKTWVHIANYTCITTPDGVDEDTIAQALITYGPLSIAVNANTFFGYKNGILDGSCETAYVNHAVTLVGFGTENGKDYWIVKNSWAEKWGEQGYIRMARGKNLCGIAEGVSSATL